MAYEGTAASGTLLQAKGALVSPAFTTATYPATTTANQLLYSSATNTVTGLSSANTSMLVTDGSGVPSLSNSLGAGFTFTSSTPGSALDLAITQTDNTNAGSHAKVVINVGGTSGGDPYVCTSVGTSRAYGIGIDNSSGGDPFSISTGATGDVRPGGGTKLLNLTSAGQQSLPFQPAFQAYVSTSITNTTGNGAQYVIASNWTSLFDQNSNFNASTGTFTAPIAGRYRFEATINMENLTGVTSLNFQFYQGNGNAYYFFEGAVAASAASNRQGLSGSVTVSMAASDTMNLRVQGQGAGGNTATVTGGIISGNPVFTGFSGSLIC